MSRFLDRFLLLAALALLNASVTFVNVWPTPRIRWDWALSVELAVGILALAWRPRHANAVARVALPAAWVLLVFGRYLDVTGPGLYGREFNLYWDAPHLANVAAMLGSALPPMMLAAGALLALAGVALAWWLARLAWMRVAAATMEDGLRRVLGVGAVAMLLAYAAQQGWGGGPSPGPFASPVSQAYLRQARFLMAMAGPSRTGQTLNDSPAMDGPFAALDGADVVLAFVEAYGVVAHDHPVLAQALAGPREVLASAIRDAGRTVVSARIESPTFGASSWLAHLSLLTGIEVRDQYAYVGVMASARDTLPKAFRRQGYQSLAMMPGLRQAWPEGAFYGFDRIYGREALEYSGPRFGWWGIPDQYTLARLDALELTGAARAPRFVVFPTSTTHAPFGPVPPYQADWAKVLTPDAFAPADVERSLGDPPDLTNLSPSYARAVAYALTTFAGYVREHAGEPMVLVLIGDHQPVAAVTGPGAAHDVPMHVIASPGLVTDRLLAAGFVEGVDPPARVLTKMHALVPILVAAFR